MPFPYSQMNAISDSILDVELTNGVDPDQYLNEHIQNLTEILLLCLHQKIVGLIHLAKTKIFVDQLNSAQLSSYQLS